MPSASACGAKVLHRIATDASAGTGSVPQAPHRLGALARCHTDIGACATLAQHASPCIRSERCRRPMIDARPSRGQLLSSCSTPRVIYCAGDPCMTPAPHASVPDTVCRCIPCVYSTLTREGRADACVHRCSVSVLNIQLSLSLSLSRARSLAPSRSQSHRRTWPEAR